MATEQRVGQGLGPLASGRLLHATSCAEAAKPADLRIILAVRPMASPCRTPPLERTGAGCEAGDNHIHRVLKRHAAQRLHAHHVAKAHVCDSVARQQWGHELGGGQTAMAADGWCQRQARACCSW